MAKLTEAQRNALTLLWEGPIDAWDERCDEFSRDGEPDTWNQLFDGGLAMQEGPGQLGDDFTLRITEAGRRAMGEKAP